MWQLQSFGPFLYFLRTSVEYRCIHSSLLWRHNCHFACFSYDCVKHVAFWLIKTLSASEVAALVLCKTCFDWVPRWPLLIHRLSPLLLSGSDVRRQGWNLIALVHVHWLSNVAMVKPSCSGWKHFNMGLPFHTTWLPWKPHYVSNQS